MSDGYQPALPAESVADALRDVVRAMGGAKTVGARMRPELPADHAGRWLSDALNDNRREHLSPQQLLWLLREGRQAGAHGAMAYLCAEAGYADPLPVAPADEAAALQRAYIDSVRAQQAIADRLERLAGLASVPPSQALRRV